ncbi:hypothetical protein CTEN210_14192 [Chaetoceros tenuissimus]|uniref:SWIM-type domain-containing protein n=1 Tax=Chaetoceros tenuissimus TaxID=426638 RepID=A0AAD3D4H8_9STRA|nr:hypothetical protein CTEN210_14192 [Chaetoceros tenuissimus]
MASSSKINDLFSSIDKSKTWDAVISLRSSVWYRDDCGVVTPHAVPTAGCTSKNREINLIECIQQSKRFLADSQILQDVHHYPKNAAFRIENFKGHSKEMKDSIIQFLKAKAREQGTEILPRKQSNNKTQYHHIRFCCKHNICQQTSTSKANFNDKLQQPMTIEGREHQPISKRHCSRSSHNTLSQCSMSQPRNEKRRINGQKNKTSTSRSETTETTCKFAFTVFCDKKSNHSDPNDALWYVSFANKPIQHTHHLPLDPEHLTAAKNDLTPEIQTFIKYNVQLNVPCHTIVGLVQKTYNLYVSHSTIRSFKEKELDDIFAKVKKIPHGQDAERLLAMMESMDDISYVYVFHEPDSGLVVYNRIRKSKEVVSSSNNAVHLALENKYRSEISEMRSQLSLDENTKVLVSICWATDDQIRSMKMFPEFSSCDMTFSLNRLRRNLFSFTVVTGHMKTVTTMHCFMPLKQTIAYIWPIAEAMPYLFGTSTTKRMLCVASDAEMALIDAIRMGTDNKRDYSTGIKHRLDMYHLVIQEWLKNVIIDSSTTLETKQCLKDIRGFILSWFTSIESEAEYRKSRKDFETMYNLAKEVGQLKDHHIIAIDGILKNFDKFRDNCGHWIFKYLPTFGFRGSSISEAENSTLKHNTPHAVDHRHTLEESGYQLIQQSQFKNKRAHTVMAADINATKIWSRSQTAPFLTKYMESLAIKFFDKREFVTAVYIGNRKWLVIRSSIFEEIEIGCVDDREGIAGVFDTDNDGTSKYTRFEHVRVVHISADNRIHCDCGFVHEYMAPCIHIMAVIDDETYLRPELYHIRWWKVFNYYFDRDYAPAMLQENLDKWTIDTESQTYQTICAVQSAILHEGYLCRGSDNYKKYMKNHQNDTAHHDDMAFGNDNEDSAYHYDGPVQGMGQLSQTGGSQSTYGQEQSQSLLTIEAFTNTTTRADFLANCALLFDTCSSQTIEEVNLIVTQKRCKEGGAIGSISNPKDVGTVAVLNAGQGTSVKGRLKSRHEYNRRNLKRSDLNNTTGNF